MMDLEYTYMSKMSLCEEEKEKLPEGVIGVLVGPLMEVTEGGEDNNNDREYTFEFIDKYIYKSPYTQKMMGYGCLFGEAYHPIDRFKIVLTEVSHAVVEMWWDETNTHLMGKLYVYDTPAGRIIMTLVRAGCHLGVSIRARGDLIRVKGKKRPNPDTYIFKGFDIVPNPGFESARLEELNESDDNTFESELKSILESSAKDSVNMVEILVNSLDEEELEPLRQEIVRRIGDTDETESLNEEIVALKEENFSLKEKLKKTPEVKEEEKEDDEEVVRDLMREREARRSLDSSLSAERSVVSAQKKQIDKLNEEILDLRGKMKELRTEKKSLEKEIERKSLDESHEERIVLHKVESSGDRREPKRKVKRSFLNESASDKVIEGEHMEDLNEEEADIMEMAKFISGIE